MIIIKKGKSNLKYLMRKTLHSLCTVVDPKKKYPNGRKCREVDFLSKANRTAAFTKSI